MKKIFLPLLAFFVMHIALQAQTQPVPKKDGKAKVAPAAAKKAVATKADGTPDMRYKVNKAKEKIKAKGPKKADGTPDMRYKANKPVKKKLN